MENIEARLERAKANKKMIEKQIKDSKASLSNKRQYVENLVKARYILSEVARLTQENFQAKVEGLITMAIRSVFDRDFHFKLQLERKRNKLECRPVIIEDEHEYSPEKDMGGGLVDVISFAWRIVLWAMEVPRSRNTIVLDEPMKNMGDLVSLGGKMLKEISKKLGIQLIVITHDQELMEFGDTSYLFTYKDGITDVKMIKGEIPKARKRLKRINKERNGVAHMKKQIVYFEETGEISTEEWSKLNIKRKEVKRKC